MTAEDVQDRESLDAYLNTLSEGERREVAVRVAYRAAARVLPIAANAFLTADWARERDLTPVAIFGAVAGPGCNAVGHPPDPDAARIANDAVNATTAAHATDDGAAYAARAARAAAEASRASADSARRAATASAAAYAATAARVGIGTAAYAAATAHAAVWEAVRADLDGQDPASPLWPGSPPEGLLSIWSDAQAAMQVPDTDWSFWIGWYDRVLTGRDWHPAAVVKVLNSITEDDWSKGPAHINPMFEDVLALYRAEDHGLAVGSERRSKAQQVAAVRAQVSALTEFLDAEYLSLSGHNARTPIDDEVLDLLGELKALAREMLRCLEAAQTNAGALIAVQENLPAVINKTGELALVEPHPEKSQTIIAMSAIIKTLTDAGADPKLATQIAMSEVAGKRIWPWIKTMFQRVLPGDGS